MTGEEVLALPMEDNDSGATTVRDYFKALLTTLMEEGEGFSGKRPFGNSGWEYELHKPLVKAGLVTGDEDGYPREDSDRAAADELIGAAIKAL